MNQIQLVGMDVSAKLLVAWVDPQPGAIEKLEVPNTPEGHRRLCRRLTRQGRQARVVMEATGLYGLDVALALHRQPGIEVMVVNPRAVRDFARACLRRSKTDALDAQVLVDFARRMPFQAWQPPTRQRLELRAIARRIAALTELRTQEKNRLHAVSSSRHLGTIVRQDLERSIRHLDRSLERLQKQAQQLVATDSQLQLAWTCLTSVKGVAAKSAIQILGELCVLPHDMTARQWVAHAGLDPRHIESGTSVHKPARISRVGNRYLRAALYMPALTATRFEPHVRAFHDQLLARGKKPLQVIVAIMRKLLHSFHAMLSDGTCFKGDGFRHLEPTAP